MARRESQSGIVILLGVLGAVLIAVFVLGKHTPPPPKVPEIKPTAISPSNSIDIDVYADGSGSIRNFFLPPPGGAHNYILEVFNQTENLLHNSSNNGSSGIWQGNKVYLWKFGSGNPSPLPTQGLVSMANHPEASSSPDTPSSFDQQQSLIEKAIDFQPERVDHSGNRSQLRIILTDLYESSEQSGKPTEHPVGILGSKLADRYLKDETGAVGVLAIRNPFVGPIEDLPGEDNETKKQFDKAADSMPFYIIFAGPASDVRHAMKVIVDGIGLTDALQSKKAFEFFFSRAPQDPNTDIKMSFSSPERAYTIDTEKSDRLHYPFIRLKKGVLQAVWDDPRQDNLNSVRIASSPRLVPKLLGGSDGTPQTTSDTPIAKVCGSETDTGPGKFCVNIDRSKMTAGTTYVFQFDLVQTASPDALKSSSDFMKLWNIQDQDARAISSMAQPTFPEVGGGHPGLTPSLTEFLGSLRDQMFNGQVRVTSYYLYVQAE